MCGEKENSQIGINKKNYFNLKAIQGDVEKEEVKLLLQFYFLLDEFKINNNLYYF